MDRREQYLHRLGIVRWRLRDQPVQATVAIAPSVSPQVPVADIVQPPAPVVLGTGKRDADWMLVGECREGESLFAGRAGELLEAMLRAIGLARDEVYAAAFTDGYGEAADSMPLGEQIERVQPALLLCFGPVAALHLLDSDNEFAALRGLVHRHPGTGTPVVVTHHPAELLERPQDKREAWEDLKLARRLVEERGR